MAHFALLDGNNTVIRVEVVSNDIATDELAGSEFLQGLYGGGNFKQTSYNANIRKNYAGIGYTFDAARDAFIAPKPFASWLLNETTCLWDAPVAMPEDAGTGEPPKRYTWDEATTSWVEVVE